MAPPLRDTCTLDRTDGNRRSGSTVWGSGSAAHCMSCARVSNKKKSVHMYVCVRAFYQQQNNTHRYLDGLAHVNVLRVSQTPRGHAFT